MFCCPIHICHSRHPNRHNVSDNLNIDISHLKGIHIFFKIIFSLFLLKLSQYLMLQCFCPHFVKLFPEMTLHGNRPILINR
jgi:hypothetical protein